jgi:hypothetical protein
MTVEPDSPHLQQCGALLFAERNNGKIFLCFGEPKRGLSPPSVPFHLSSNCGKNEEAGPT